MRRFTNGWTTAFGVLGAVVGLFWVFVAGTAMNLYTSLTPTWNTAMYFTCPVIRSIFVAWWLVPILNGLAYLGLAVLILLPLRRRSI